MKWILIAGLGYVGYVLGSTRFCADCCADCDSKGVFSHVLEPTADKLELAFGRIVEETNGIKEKLFTSSSQERAGAGSGCGCKG